jgi:reverse gyrase
MKGVKVIKTKFEFSINGLKKEQEFVTKILEDGFNKMFPFKVYEINEGSYNIESFDPEKDLVTRPSITLFKEGDLVALMKERKIGRPSTYATIVSTLLERKYVIKIKNEKLVNTTLGKRVYEFLKSKYEKYITEDVTRDLEEKMDKIEKGEAKYEEVLNEIYKEALEIRNS